MNIKKIPSNYVVLLLLAVVFFTTQWSTIHVHLAEQHSHDGGAHQHQPEAHAHSLIEQATTNDYLHQLSHTNIVELGSEYCFSKNDTQKKALTFIVDTSPCLSPFLLLVSSKIRGFESSKSSYLNRSTLNPRAPPQISSI